MFSNRGNGSTDAQGNPFRYLVFSLLLVFVLMIGCKVDKEKQLISKAKNGDVHAMYELGMANTSISGDGIVSNPNYRDAVYWFEEAAEHGHTTSMYFLSQIRGQPEGRQVMWLKKGAEMGNKACMVELSNSYFHQMHGLSKDIGAFLYWEARVSEATMKENGRDQQTMTRMLKEGEERRRKEMHYDGPIRPFP
jgi:TPR repeat protein